MELIRITSAILRRKWLLIQAVLFFTVLSVVLTRNMPRQYKATTKVMVSTSDASMSVLSDMGLQELVSGMSDASDEMQNHIAMLTTRPILEEVVWNLQLRLDSGRLMPPEKLLVPGMLAAFEAPPSLSVKQHQSTDIIHIDALSDDPNLSSLLANTLANVYIAETKSRSRAETREARSFVESRLSVVQGEFEQALSQIASAQEREQVVDLESEVRSAVTRLSDLMMAGEENTARIQEVQAQIRQVKTLQGMESVNFVGPSTVNENPDIRGYRESLAQMRHQRQVLLKDKTEMHPDVKAVDMQIQAMEQDLARALAEQHDLDPTLLALQTELAGLVQKGAELNSAIDRTTDRFATYPEKMQTLTQLQLAATAAEEVYKSLQDQSYQIAIAEAMTVSPLQLLEPAIRPERHISPKMTSNLIVGMFLGFLMGMALVALFEYIDDSVKSAEALREVWDVPVLGMIPRVKTDKLTIAELPPTDVAVESFRSLRTSLDYTSLDKPSRLICVSSALPGEGKSTVTNSLAISLARAGKRVLVVDCDLRRPVQHLFWKGMANDMGVTTVLVGKCELPDAVQSSAVEGLDVLVAGPVPPNPGKLVESLKLRQLLLEASKHYDLVLVDSPPVLLVNDAVLINRVVDSFLMVVACASTSRRAIAEARDRLKGSGTEPLGTVFNKVQTRLGYYSGQDKRAYAAYYRTGPSTGSETEKRGGAA
ncbi:MAG: polysaccharide biosynthesis tyrosine autokinase [Myxococcota bacterium]|nr:polysaccharide biosynthesis tyrosine autokinase [Myxococcota bacterium]